MTESLCGCVCTWFIKIYYLYVKRGEGKIEVKVIWTLKEDNFIKFNPCDTFLIDLQDKYGCSLTSFVPEDFLGKYCLKTQF